MTPPPLPLRKRIALLLLLAAVAMAPAALIVDRLFGREVLLISPHDSATVTLNRTLHVPGDPVPEIYGYSLNRPTRVVLFSKRDVLRPIEDRSLLLLPIRASGARPLQVQTLFLVARHMIVVLLLLSLLMAFFPIPQGPDLQRLKNLLMERP